jgi:hypothetical protein
MTNDLRELFQAVQSDGPPLKHSADDIVAGGRRLRRRRRTVWAACASAVVVAGVAAVVALPQVIPLRQDSTDPPVAPAAPAPAAPIGYPEAPWAMSLRAYQVGVFAVSDAVLVTPGYQQAVIVKDNYKNNFEDADGTVRSFEYAQAAITMYRPGAFDPQAYIGGKPVKVNGRDGFLANVGFGRDLVDMTNDPALAWQYGDNAWAVLSAMDAGVLSDDDMVAVAAGLKTGEPRTARVPFRLSHLTSGYKLTTAGSRGEFPFGAAIDRSWIRLVERAPSYEKLTQPVIGDLHLTSDTGMKLSVGPAWNNNHEAPAGKKGDSWCPESALCYRQSADGKWVAQIEGDSKQSDDELRKVLDGLEFADPDRPQTWHDVTSDAVPARVK